MQKLELHKSTAADFGQLPEPHRLVKSNSFRGVVRGQFNLPHMAVSVQYGLQERRADAFSLMLREHQNILNEHDGFSITHSTNNAKKLIAIISRQCQHGIFKALFQHLGMVGVSSPAYTLIEMQDLRFAISTILSDFHISNLQLNC